MYYYGDKSYDDIDVKIIHELRHNGRISMKELGDKVHLTGQAVKNRIEKLEAIGVLQRYTINVDCPVFGYKIHAILEVEVKSERKTDFLNFVTESEVPILHCYSITGANRYMIDAHFISMENLGEFKVSLEGFGAIQVHIILEELKHVENK